MENNTTIPILYSSCYILSIVGDITSTYIPTEGYLQCYIVTYVHVIRELEDSEHVETDLIDAGIALDSCDSQQVDILQVFIQYQQKCACVVESTVRINYQQPLVATRRRHIPSVRQTEYEIVIAH